jgi:hypothetical protein
MMITAQLWNALWFGVGAAVAVAVFGCLIREFKKRL